MQTNIILDRKHIRYNLGTCFISLKLKTKTNESFQRQRCMKTITASKSGNNFVTVAAAHDRRGRLYRGVPSDTDAVSWFPPGHPCLSGERRMREEYRVVRIASR